MKTVHLIGNAHLDPVWLWRQSEGIDAALATARSACDRLDEYPRFVFTCSASWFHQQVELLDTKLFERIVRFVDAGRWQIVGGMVVQPDCNLPSAESFARQLQTGRAYFRERFDRDVTVGYNVDSFGHTGYLPRYLRQAGMDSYVFMRPAPQEKSLPASLFRWRSVDGHEVIAFRIIGSYATDEVELTEQVTACVAACPEGIDHTMFFYGVGDHGGGPTRAQIEWLEAHADGFAGATLVFSHPRAFFDAVAEHVEKLPVVVGELQHHAIGCYSVARRIKVAMRRAEAALAQAEAAAELFPRHGLGDLPGTLRDAWADVLFNQFHDILAGSSLYRASERAAAVLLAAESRAEAALTAVTRSAFRSQAEPGVHKIVVFNPCDAVFDGYIEHKAWWDPSKPQMTLLDEQDRELPHQCRPSLSLRNAAWLLFRLAVPAGGHRILRLTEGAGSPRPTQTASDGSVSNVDEDGLSNERVRVSFDGQEVRLGGWSVRLDVCEDLTDTWSHSAGHSFTGPRIGGVTWRDVWRPAETGPLRVAAHRPAEFGSSRLWCRWMLTADEPAPRLRLRVVWSQARQMLRLRLAAPDEIRRRVDLVSGGPHERAIDGREYPLGGGMVLRTGEGRTLAVVAPEVFSVSVRAREVNLLLLRSPLAAHHDPYPAERTPEQPVTDQGYHEFDLILWPGCPADLGAAAGMARGMAMPPVTWELTG